MKFCAVFAEPSTRIRYIVADRVNQRPEPRAMVHFTQMRHFVCNDVVEDIFRRHHQSPGKIQIARA